MTRAELLWLAVLFAGLTWLILGTSRAEQERARARHARDTLQYLAGHLRMATDGTGGLYALPGLLAGPGELPAAYAGRQPQPLADHLPEGVYLPADPWGRAFLVFRAAGPGGTMPVVASAGPDDELQPVPGELGPLMESLLPRRRGG